MALTTSAEKNGPAQVLTVEGEIDALSVKDFQKSLHPLLNTTPANIILNCEGIKYINSRGVGVLVQSHRQSMLNRGMLVLINVSPALVKVFDLTRITETFVFADTLEDALAKFA